MKKLPFEFYNRAEVQKVARELLGKYLRVQGGEGVSGGRIVEVEAYDGRCDRACHAYGGRRTARTETMYQPGGVAYVYLCYGIHRMMNVVTHAAGMADAVLIRAIAPTEGLSQMLLRRGMSQPAPRLSSGPGCLTEALGITLAHDGLSLQGPELWIEDHGEVLADADIASGPRIGVAYAGPDALLPWRFWIRDNPWVSRQK